MQLQLEHLLRRALDGLEAKRFDEFDLEKGANPLEWTLSNNLFFSSVNFVQLRATGFTRDGARAISDISQLFRESSAERKRSVSASLLNAAVAKEIVSRFASAGGVCSQTNIQDFQAAIELWFEVHGFTRKHLVPCALSPWPLGSFRMGPINFFHASAFDPEAYGVSKQDVWPVPKPRSRQLLGKVWAWLRRRPAPLDPKPGGFHFEALFRQMRERYGDWIAEVEVTGREAGQSVLAADLAVDIALGGLQILLASNEFHRAHRLTARAAPVWRSDVWATDGMASGPSAQNSQPGRAVDVQGLNTFLQHHDAGLQSIGRRLSAYLSGTGSTPRLDEAWCEAAYWYHEALAETLDTVRVAKLETAMEVLLGAESTKQSNSRLIEGFGAFFNLSGSDLLPGSQLSVKQFVASIVTARSRVLHGTWPTLANDLPGISFGSVNELSRHFLIAFTLELDRYAANGQTSDTTSSFLSWVKTNRMTRPP